VYCRKSKGLKVYAYVIMSNHFHCIVSAENKTYQQVFNLIAKGFGKKQPAKKVTPFFAALAWRVEAIKSWFTKNDPLLTKETTKKIYAQISQLTATTAKIENEKAKSDYSMV
jgi:hypothetical protein